MKKLETICESLNTIEVNGKKSKSGAAYEYKVLLDGATQSQSITFQEGKRMKDNKHNGVLDCDLLEIIKDRLTGFQKGPYACAENEEALGYVVKALEAMNNRVTDRKERGVFGTNQK